MEIIERYFAAENANDGLTAREQAWFDTAGVQRQIEAHRRAPGQPSHREVISAPTAP
jgi:hypothetical protein